MDCIPVQYCHCCALEQWKQVAEPECMEVVEQECREIAEQQCREAAEQQAVAV